MTAGASEVTTTGVFGGSFNPVHNGHIALAREVVRQGLADRVMLVLSPLNPLKANSQALQPDSIRMEMLRLACAPYPELEASDIELSMPRPSYTIDTLHRLSQERPGERFRLIIGADNWAIFNRWRASEELLRDYSPIVYPRDDFPMPEDGSGATPLSSTLFPYSSTEVRNRLESGLPVNNMVAPEVLSYIKQHNIWKQTL